MSKNRRAQHTRHGGPALLQLVVFPMLNYPKLTMFEYQTIAGESFFSFLNRSDQDNKNSSIAHDPLGAYVRKVCYTRLVKGLCGKYTSFFRAGKKNRATGRKKCRFIRRVPARPIISIARPTSPRTISCPAFTDGAPASVRAVLAKAPGPSIESFWTGFRCPAIDFVIIPFEPHGIFLAFSKKAISL